MHALLVCSSIDCTSQGPYHPTTPIHPPTKPNTHNQVMYGEEVVFSKLATGRMPTGEELVSRLRELGLE